eukprot:359529_1
MFRCTPIVQVRKVNAFGAFIKQVYKTNKFPAVKAQLGKVVGKAKSNSPAAFKVRAKTIAAAYKALDKKAVAALRKDAKSIKIKKAVTRKSKFLKSKANARALKGFSGKAKLTKLNSLWRNKK